MLNSDVNKVEQQNIESADLQSVEKMLASEDKSLTRQENDFCALYAYTGNIQSAYQKAFCTSYQKAAKRAPELLAERPDIRLHIAKLKEIRNKELAQSLDGNVLINQLLQIATADITDFIEFGEEVIEVVGEDKTPIMNNSGEPIYIRQNFIKFKDSKEINGQLIAQISTGRSGASIKLQDKMTAINKLVEILNLSPAQQQRLENDRERLELEKAKFEKENKKISKVQLELIDAMPGQDNDTEIYIVEVPDE